MTMVFNDEVEQMFAGPKVDQEAPKPLFSDLKPEDEERLKKVETELADLLTKSTQFWDESSAKMMSLTERSDKVVQDFNQKLELQKKEGELILMQKINEGVLALEVKNEELKTHVG